MRVLERFSFAEVPERDADRVVERRPGPRSAGGRCASSSLAADARRFSPSPLTLVGSLPRSTLVGSPGVPPARPGSAERRVPP